MITKDDLIRYSNIDSERQHYIRLIENINETAESPHTANITGMPRGNDGEQDRMATIIAKLVDLQKGYEAKIAELADLQDRVEVALEPLTYDEQMTIRLRYFEGLEWEDVGEHLHCSRRQAIRIHDAVMGKLAG